MSDSHSPEALASLRPLLYANAAVEAWTAHDKGTAAEPWAAFERARTLVRVGRSDEAAGIWWQITHADGLESRHTLQAWHFLRQAGRTPAAEAAKRVLGVVVEMPVANSRDLLAAYADGSARYINHSGKVAVVEDRSSAEIQAAIEGWIAVAATITPRIGPWDEPTFPQLGPDDARIAMLTPSGPHVGQGPAAALLSDPTAGAFINAATGLLQLLVDRTSG